MRRGADPGAREPSTSESAMDHPEQVGAGKHFKATLGGTSRGEHLLGRDEGSGHSCDAKVVGRPTAYVAAWSSLCAQDLARCYRLLVEASLRRPPGGTPTHGSPAQKIGESRSCRCPTCVSGPGRSIGAHVRGSAWSTFRRRHRGAQRSAVARSRGDLRPRACRRLGQSGPPDPC